MTDDHVRKIMSYITLKISNNWAYKADDMKSRTVNTKQLVNKYNLENGARQSINNIANKKWYMAQAYQTAPFLTTLKVIQASIFKCDVLNH